MRLFNYSSDELNEKFDENKRFAINLINLENRLISSKSHSIHRLTNMFMIMKSNSFSVSRTELQLMKHQDGPQVGAWKTEG